MIVINNRWLISWIGDADHAAFEKEGSAGIGVGPIATALLDSVRYDKVCLLTNYPHSRSSKFCYWLEVKTSYAGKTIDLQELDTYKELEGLEYSLPSSRNLHKDTANYMILM